MSQAKVYSSQFSFQGMVEARANTLIEGSSREEFALTRDPVCILCDLTHGKYLRYLDFQGII